MICGSAISYRNTLQNPDFAYPLTSDVPNFSMTSANSLIDVLSRNLRNLRIIRALRNFRVFHRDRNQHTSWRPPSSRSGWPRPPAYQPHSARREARAPDYISANHADNHWLCPTTLQLKWKWNEWMTDRLGCGNALAVAVISLQLPAIPQVIVLNYRELITFGNYAM